MGFVKHVKAKITSKDVTLNFGIVIVESHQVMDIITSMVVVHHVKKFITKAKRKLAGHQNGDRYKFNTTGNITLEDIKEKINIQQGKCVNPSLNSYLKLLTYICYINKMSVSEFHLIMRDHTVYMYDIINGNKMNTDEYDYVDQFDELTEELSNRKHRTHVDGTDATKIFICTELQYLWENAV